MCLRLRHLGGLFDSNNKGPLWNHHSLAQGPFLGNGDLCGYLATLCNGRTGPLRSKGLCGVDIYLGSHSKSWVCNREEINQKSKIRKKMVNKMNFDPPSYHNFQSGNGREIQRNPSPTAQQCCKGRRITSLLEAWRSPISQ